MSVLVRSSTITHYPELARSVGLDPLAMLRKARLPVTCVERPDTRIPVTSLRRLLELSAAESGVEEFGLRLADRGALSNLGPVALIVREQANVGDALQALSRFIHIHHEGMRLPVEQSDDVVSITVVQRSGLSRPPRQASEMALGTLHRIVRRLAGADWRPLEIHLQHPPPKNRRFYRQFFGCSVVFNSEHDAILFSARDLDRAIPMYQPQIASYLQRRVEAIDVRPQRWDEKVSEAVRSLLAEGDCSVERIAEHFACNRRTIHRHLAGCGTSFSEILDKERADLVLRMIEDRSRPLAGIAGQLGFSAQSALARWFKGRFGCSIGEWRTGTRQRTIAAVGRW